MSRLKNEFGWYKGNYFRDGQTPKSVEIDNFFDYTMQLINTVLAVQDSQHLHSDDWQRTVYIDTLGVNTTKLRISAKQVQCA